MSWVTLHNKRSVESILLYDYSSFTFLALPFHFSPTRIDVTASSVSFQWTSCTLEPNCQWTSARITVQTSYLDFKIRWIWNYKTPNMEYRCYTFLVRSGNKESLIIKPRIYVGIYIYEKKSTPHSFGISLKYTLGSRRNTGIIVYFNTNPIIMISIFNDEPQLFLIMPYSAVQLTQCHGIYAKE